LDTAWQSELARLAILVKRRRLAPSFCAVSSEIPQSSFDLGPIRKNLQAYKKEGPKFMQHLVAKQKAKVKEL